MLKVDPKTGTIRQELVPPSKPEQPASNPLPGPHPEAEKPKKKGK